MTIRINMFVVGAIGTNCYLVWEDESGEAMIIDPGAYEPTIEHTIAENGLLLKYIALTHGHGDHIGGVPDFKSAHPDAVIAASAQEISLLESPASNGSEAMTGRSVKFTPEQLLQEGDALTLGDLTFQVIETPGHTPGGLCFYVPEWDNDLIAHAYSGTLFSGDTLFHESVGRTDLTGGDFGTLKRSIREKLFALPDDTIVLPGHMDATTIGREKKYNNFVR